MMSAAANARCSFLPGGLMIHTMHPDCGSGGGFETRPYIRMDRSTLRKVERQQL
jgi:hypothetical protein